MVMFGVDDFSSMEDVIEDSYPHGTRTKTAPITPEENRTMAQNSKAPATAKTRKRTPAEYHHRAAAQHTAAAHHHLEAAHHHEMSELEPARKHSEAAQRHSGKAQKYTTDAREQSNQ